jgi:hypothetical protein
MTKRAQKIAVFAETYANAQRAKRLASKPSCTNDACCIAPSVPPICMPVERYMLSEQAHIREIGYSH